MSKIIIFKDGEIQGYLDNETDLKKVSAIADKLIEECKNRSGTKVRVFKENIENGINIYCQSIGEYINGFVHLEHVICWKIIYEYKI
jgi:hypothetical protein